RPGKKASSVRRIARGSGCSSSRISPGMLSVPSASTMLCAVNGTMPGSGVSMADVTVPASPAPDELHGLGPGGHVGAEQAAHRGGDGGCARLLHTPHGHAQVLGLYHDEHAAGRERLVDGV